MNACSNEISSGSIIEDKEKSMNFIFGLRKSQDTYRRSISKKSLAIEISNK